MICNAKPYEGKEPYAFVCYSHKDEGIVYPLIERLSRNGCRLWYDSGIHAGEDWPEVIADHLQHCSVVLYFMSKESVDSHNCRNELNLAIEIEKPLLPVRYNNAKMTLGMRLMLNNVQWIDCPEKPTDLIIDRIMMGPSLKTCIGRQDTNVLVQEYRLPESENINNVVPVKIVNFEASIVDNEIINNKKSKPDKSVKECTEIDMDTPVGKNTDDLSNETDILLDAGRVTQEHLQNDNEYVGEETIVDTRMEDDFEQTIVSAPSIPPVVVCLSSGICYRCFRDITKIGRGKTSDIRIVDSDHRISREHVKLVQLEQQCFISDMNSSNGTWVDGKKLEPGESMEIKNISEVVLAKEVFLIAVNESALQLWNSNLIVGLKAEKTDEIRYLASGSMELGRNHIWKSGALKAPNIGREHATLRIEGENCYIIDHSRNGTYINNEKNRIENGQMRQLVTGDRIHLGDETIAVTCIPTKRSDEI